MGLFNKTKVDEPYSSQYLMDQITQLKKRIRGLENPPKFKPGDEVEYRTGATNFKYVRGKVIKVEFNGTHWQWDYHLWIDERSEIYIYDDDDFYNNKEFVQIRKHVPNTRTKK